VDALVERMGRLDLQLALLDADYNERLYDLLADYRGRAAGILAERAEIQSAIEIFCRERKAEFVRKRSRVLTFGRVSFRVAERIKIPKGKEEIVVKALLALGLTECLRTVQKPDLDAMRKLSDSDLARTGARREKTDHFKIEPNLESIAKETGAEIAPPDKARIDLGKLVEAMV
jgi:phage host-nuclease inhibitor protein Gam